jgi:hypothetical protein
MTGSRMPAVNETAFDPRSDEPSCGGEGAARLTISACFLGCSALCKWSNALRSADPIYQLHQ